MSRIHRDERGRYFTLEHVVCFEETNIVGNVYYANHVLWQGRCREMFLRDFAPSVLEDIKGGMALVTLRVSCDYLAELYAFDEVAIRMRLGWLRQNRVQLLFEYVRMHGETRELVARGEQQVACMHSEAGRLAPRPFPPAIIATFESLHLVEPSE